MRWHTHGDTASRSHHHCCCCSHIHSHSRNQARYHMTGTSHSGRKSKGKKQKKGPSLPRPIHTSRCIIYTHQGAKPNALPDTTQRNAMAKKQQPTYQVYQLHPRASNPTPLQSRPKSSTKRSVNKNEGQSTKTKRTQQTPKV